MIIRQKIALLHIAKKELGLSDEDYRDLLSGVTGGRADSSGASNFYDGDFKKAMQIMQHLGYNRRLKMSQKQYSTILKLSRRLGWSGQPRRLAGYSRRIIGFAEWKNATVRQAGYLIQALVKLMEYEHAETNER